MAQLGITLASRNRVNGKTIKPSLGGPSAHSSGVSALQADMQEGPARCQGVPSYLVNMVLTCFASSIAVVVHWRRLTKTLDSGESMVTP